MEQKTGKFYKIYISAMFWHIVHLTLQGETFGSCVTFGANKQCSAPGQYGMQDLAMILETIHKSNENGR